MSIAGHATGDGPLAGIAAEMGIDAREIAARKLFLELGSTDAEQLKALNVRLATAQNGFADGFYDYLRAIPELQALLPDEGAVRRLRTAHNRYFASLIGGDYDEDYVVRRLQVGMTHARIGLTPKWYVGAFRKYLSDMLQVVWQASDGDFSRFSPAFDALLKVVMLDLGLTLDTYIHADKHAIALRDQAIDSSNNGIFIATNAPECTLVYVNRAFSRMLDRDREAGAGDPCPCTDGEDCFGSIRKAIAEGRDGLVNLQRQRPDGSMQWIELFLAPVSDDSGRTTHYVGILDDITARKESEAHLDYLVRHDPLTGLPNRELLLQQTGSAMSQAGGRQSLALHAIDLDHFKLINDGLGHRAGDRVLQEMANRLTGISGENACVARLSSDEFAILTVASAGADAVAAFAEQIRKALKRPFHDGGREIALDASIGIAVFPGDGDDPESLLRNANSALHAAKAAGRASTRFYDEAMNRRADERLALVSDLRHAVRRQQLRLYYQPQIDAADGTLAGVEALLRWQHPERGLVPPDAFIPLAEECGLIGELGAWVLAEAIRQASEWRARGIGIPRVAVNLSPKQFSDPGLATRIETLLAEHALAPSGLELEITESTAMHDPEGTAATLRRLRSHGIRLALDDFGTGHSSLAVLRTLPFDLLKLDRSFVRHIPAAASDAAVAGTIITLARQLGLEVIAEGVEDEAQQTHLAEAGCHFLQGFLFSRPLPVAALEDWLAGR